MQILTPVILRTFHLIFVLFLVVSCKNERESELLTPEQAIRDFQVEDGFEVQTVAAEPLVEDPVALAFDADANMWVVELRGYMHDEDGAGEDLPLGRIKVLSDKDDDGEYETASVFIDSLIMPRAVAIVSGGVLLIEPPVLYFVENREGKAGKKVILDPAFAETGNVEHQPNGLMRSIDNWIYCAKGNKRVRLINNEWKIEPTIQRGQWGISQDDMGRLMYNDNSTMLMADNFLPGIFSNVERAFISGKAVHSRISSNRVYPGRETRGINRGYQENMLDEEGKLVNVTSACGPVIYRGDNFPEAYQGNAFVMEPAAFLIKRILINETADGLLKGTFAYHNKEFLTSGDERFRPVNAYNAPDGSLYVIDMHRGIIQHTTYLTPYLRKHIDSMNLERPIGMGRIFRIKWKDKAISKKNALSGTTSAELVRLLSQANGWYRDMAQKVLVERKDVSVADDLKEIVLGNNISRTKLHALFALEGMGALDIELLEKVAETGERELYQAAVYLLSQLNDKKAAEVVIAKYKPVDRLETVVFLAALYRLRSERVAEHMLNALAKYPNDSLITDALLHVMPGNEERFERSLLSQVNLQDTLFRKVHSDIVMREQLARQNNIENLTNQEKEMYQTGKDNYSRFCASCHGANGEGLINIAPPLALSEWVTHKNFDVPARIVLDGMTGPVDVNGKMYGPPDYQGVMQGLRDNIETNNGVIASVLTYIRNSWGNSASAVTVEEVADVRKATENRTKPYTQAELYSSNMLLEKDTIWQEIFNGKDLSGWSRVGGKALYKVENGTITGYTVMQTPNSFLTTDKVYDDFVLELEVWIDTSLNSGIQIRSNSDPSYKNGVFHGYQVEIDPSSRAWSGGIYDESRRGWLVDLKDKPMAQRAFNKNGWNRYRIEAIGDTIKTFVNGIPVAVLKDGMTLSGKIGLQVHSIGESSLEGRQVKWRKVRVFEVRGD